MALARCDDVVFFLGDVKGIFWGGRIKGRAKKRNITDWEYYPRPIYISDFDSGALRHGTTHRLSPPAFQTDGRTPFSQLGHWRMIQGRRTENVRSIKKKYIIARCVRRLSLFLPVDFSASLLSDLSVCQPVQSPITEGYHDRKIACTVAHLAGRPILISVKHWRHWHSACADRSYTGGRDDGWAASVGTV